MRRFSSLCLAIPVFPNLPCFYRLAGRKIGGALLCLNVSSFKFG